MDNVLCCFRNKFCRDVFHITAFIEMSDLEVKNEGREEKEKTRKNAGTNADFIPQKTVQEEVNSKKREDHSTLLVSRKRSCGPEEGTC